MKTKQFLSIQLLRNMMIPGLILINWLTSSVNLQAQTNWVQKNAGWSGCYAQSNAFCVLGNKAYLGLGTNYCTDWWEFDPVTDTYTPRADFPDTSVAAPTVFSIGGYAYVLSVNNKLWKYDPISDAWTNTGSNFPGTVRYGSYFVSIGNKGYLAGGADLVNSNNLNDCWEYNQPTNTWTQLANMPMANSFGEAFTLMGKMYLTGGIEATGGSYATMKVFEYNPATNTWANKNDFPDGRFSASGFVIGNDAYIGMGVVTSSTGTTLPYSTVYTYNYLADSWGLVADIPFAEIYDEGVGFSINGKGYMGLGDCNGVTLCNPGYQPYIFEYTPPGMFIENSASNPGVNMGPNPTSGQVLLSTPESGIQQVQIYNALGEVQETFLYPNSPASVELDLSHLPSGMYFVQTQINQQTVVKKLWIE